MNFTQAIPCTESMVSPFLSLVQYVCTSDKSLSIQTLQAETSAQCDTQNVNEKWFGYSLASLTGWLSSECKRMCPTFMWVNEENTQSLEMCTKQNS